MPSFRAAPLRSLPAPPPRVLVEKEPKKRRTSDFHHGISHTTFQRSVPAPSSPAKPIPNLRDDKLGKLVNHALDVLKHSVSWHHFVRTIRQRYHLHVDLATLDHPAAPLLFRFRNSGVPVVTSDTPWSKEHVDSLAARGPHSSTLEHNSFVREEMADFAEKGHWVVLPYETVRHFPQLRLSPLGCIPQRDRRPRLIVDNTFFGVNAATVELSPREAMQFGRTLDRILHKIRFANPKFGPVFLCKLDVSDGFYRISLSSSGALKLAVVLPPTEGEPQLVAIPLSLPMGWKQSPPAFCAATETAADLVNRALHHHYSPPHHLDHLAETPPPDPPAPTPFPQVPGAPKPVPSLPQPSHPVSQPATRPLNYCDVYVDDFCNLVQGNPRRRTIVRRTIMHHIDKVFPPLHPLPEGPHKEPISIKKLKQGDGYWSTRKVLLGWEIDTIAQTINLPAHRLDRLKEIFDSLRHKSRTTIKAWRKILGELRSMVLAIPGGKGLFSALQHGLQVATNHRIRINNSIRQFLTDMEWLAYDLHNRPTRLAEIVPDQLSAIGTVDAAGPGMGGIWLHPNLQPLLWRAPFPRSIQRLLVSSDNPTGSITNSDLEQAGMIAHQDIIAQHWDVRERTIASLGDNTPALSRMAKGSVTSIDIPAHLCRLSALHQRHHRYLAQYDHIAGSANSMADDCSRLWHLTDSQLLSHFQQTYPQEQPWKLVHLRPEMLSCLTSTLLRKPVKLLSLLNVPPQRKELGTFGLNSAANSESLPPWKQSRTLSLTSKFSVTDVAMDDYPSAKTLSEVVQWKGTYAPSVRRWPAWGPVTHASPLRAT